ncbi:hypothetical protein [Asticcacaulis sp.]|uniref:hypothetical protein n=1 Tax=Asticcacaulis sp. TaxID=1872648 RepID=UPI00261B3257|nr:hypothetical protein [Asticcacaulis sp.]
MRPETAKLNTPSTASKHTNDIGLLSALDTHAVIEAKMPLKWTLMGLFITCGGFWALVAGLATRH